MNNRTLEIILKLKDELTKKMVGVEGALRQFSVNMKNLSRDLKKIGTDVQHVGNFFIGFGAVLTGPLALAFNASAKYSRKVSDEIEHAKTVSTAFQLSLANALVPVMQTINNLLGRAYKAWVDLGEAKQRTIVQVVFLTGVFATLGGLILRVIGSVMKTAGTIISLVMKLNPVSIAVMAIVGAVVLMIEYWEQCRDVVIPVLNAIEAGLSVIASGLASVVSASVKPMAFLLGLYEKLMALLSKLPGPQQKLFQSITDGLSKARKELDKFSASANDISDGLAGHAVETWAGKEGVLASGMDGLSKKWKELKSSLSDGGINYDLLKSQLDAAEANAKLWANTMTTITQQTAQSMSSSMSTIFFDAFTGQLKSAKDYLADFGRSILQVLSQALAKLVLVKTIGAAFPGMASFFHQGGVVRAHSGYLASDEIPIIAQSGEGIISRRGMASLGASNLQRLNRGEGGGNGGVTININPVIQAWDASDVMRNKNALTAIIGESIKNNSEIRTIIRKYA